MKEENKQSMVERFDELYQSFQLCEVINKKDFIKLRQFLSEEVEDAYDRGSEEATTVCNDVLAEEKQRWKEEIIDWIDKNGDEGIMYLADLKDYLK